MKNYWGDNESPPVFSTVAELTEASDCDHCKNLEEQADFGSVDPEAKEKYQKKLISKVDRILKCDPTNYKEILNMDGIERWTQVDIDCKFVFLARWISLYLIP